ncbi:adenylate/guanylate cyclase domain-containing protein [Aeromicrobium sp. CnD17-E]|uniref:adenylate/guanylate cyclase domain-containing protein n=1 Tax=Aeromicrobium sp. CnD17-E TaxID=2954487 RepID=UPI002096CE80|nr:adenylate/guanylate cyclase domain-containing protein [Aeromicrobium sp. CnD17-E]MCO7239347.1 adenylate/guanylate cyclase domain-containing protein [Aeromicrobium sp. CnD17-E]
MNEHAEQSAFDPSLLIDVAGEYLFDSAPTLTQREVADRAGMDLDLANSLWRYLGFPEVEDDRVAFTEADVEALRVTKRLIDLGVLEEDRLPQFVRSLGRTFARLADWQTRLLLGVLQTAEDGEQPPLDVLAEVIPMVEEVQGYVWRRHLLATASRIALRDVRSETERQLVVGFVDIVGYTSRSRQMSPRALGAMVEWFERVVTELVVQHGGQVIKTIGDEALFTVDDPTEGALLALELVERAEADEQFPDVRVGLAHGPVLARLGDVFGSTVNIAARLTSVARPARVLVDADLAELLDHDEFRLRRTRRVSVKGYEHLEPWSLKRQRER